MIRWGDLPGHRRSWASRGIIFEDSDSPRRRGVAPAEDIIHRVASVSLEHIQILFNRARYVVSDGAVSKD